MEKVISVIISKVTTKKTSETTYTNINSLSRTILFYEILCFESSNFLLEFPSVIGGREVSKAELIYIET